MCVYEGSMNQISDEIRYKFESIQKEFSDHLESINANTNEIQSNYEQIAKLEYKIDKLTERVDEVTLLLRSILKEPEKHLKHSSEEIISIQKLSKNEECIFNMLYNSDDSYLTYDKIARKCGLTQSLVIAYIANLIAKGVPVTKRYINCKVHLSLEQEFKELQAKHNIANISRTMRDYAV